MPGKIGILTYFWSPNHGTFLQAYSTLRAFQKRFPEHRVELINLRGRRIFFYPHKRDINPAVFWQHWRRHFIFNRCRKRDLVLSPTGTVMPDYNEAVEFIEAQHYDMIAVGADVVLEMPEANLARKEPTIYWLPPRIKCRKVVCAASCAALEVDSLDETLRQKMAEAIQGFDLVGVRGDLTLDLMESLGLKGDPRLDRLPDAAFTYEIDPSLGYAVLKRRGIDVSRPTMAFSLATEPDCDALIAHFNAKGFQTVSFESPRPANFWLWSITPHEWAGLHRQFMFEVTDRFHGTLFSLRNGIPVFAVDRKGQFASSGASKKRSLLRSFGLEKTNHVNLVQAGGVEGAVKAIDAAMERTWDRKAVLRRAEEFRLQYEAFLDRVAALL